MLAKCFFTGGVQAGKCEGDATKVVNFRGVSIPACNACCNHFRLKEFDRADRS